MHSGLPAVLVISGGIAAYIVCIERSRIQELRISTYIDKHTVLPHRQTFSASMVDIGIKRCPWLCLSGVSVLGYFYTNDLSYLPLVLGHEDLYRLGCDPRWSGCLSPAGVLLLCQSATSLILACASVSPLCQSAISLILACAGVSLLCRFAIVYPYEIQSDCAGSNLVARNPG
jgi:hypothetical protein